MKSKNRILFLSNRGLLPVKDGHTMRSFHILKGLARNNRIYFLSLFETQEEIAPENVRELKKICHRVEFFPAPPKTIGFGMAARLIRSLVSPEPYTIWRHYSGAFLKRVNEFISSEKVDIVHCDILPLCYTVRSRNDVFRSVTDHDVSYLKCYRMARGTSAGALKLFLYLEAWKLRRLEKKIFRQVDLGITVSELDKCVLSRLCPEGVFLVVENGIDPDRFFPSEDLGEQRKLLWLGGFDHYPNKEAILFFLRKIYPLVKKTDSGVSVDIVGGGVDSEIMSVADGDPGIHFTGYVDDPLPYIQRATVFVAPVLSGGGTKLKVLEAMASGKAIVTTSVGAEGIDGVAGIHYLMADDSKQFADAVVRLLHDESLRMLLQGNARKFAVEKHDYIEICRKLDGYYRSVSLGKSTGEGRNASQY